MQGATAVFGFGRQLPCCDAYPTVVPDRYPAGLGEGSSVAQAQQLIADASREVSVTVGTPAEHPAQ